MANAWNNYIDTIIAHSKDPQGNCHIDRIAIFSLDGGQLWTDNTHANHFNIQPEESNKLARSMLTKNFEELQMNGFRIDGMKYRFLKEDDKMVCFKSGVEGATFYASKSAILGAHCPEGSQQGYANKACSIIAEYLESMNM